MNQTSLDELIGAYLDGELKPDEQVRVERLLDESAEHRRMLSELRTLRDLIRSVSRQAVGKGFSESVVRQVEQRRLPGERNKNSGGAQESQLLATNEEQEAKRVQPIHRATDTSRGMRRGAVWATLAVAASLLIALFYGPPTQDPPRRSVAAHGRLHDQPAKKRDLRNLDKIVKQNANPEDERGQLPHQAEKPEAEIAPRNAIVEDSIGRKDLPSAAESDGSGVNETRGPAAVDERAANRMRAADAADIHSAESSVSAKGIASGVDEPFVVVVELPQAALAGRIVDATLASNGVVMLDRTISDRGGSDFRSEASAEGLTRQADTIAADTIGTLELAEESDFEESDISGFEVVVVHATLEQIGATIASLTGSGYRLALREDMEKPAQAALGERLAPEPQQQVFGKCIELDQSTSRDAAAKPGTAPPGADTAAELSNLHAKKRRHGFRRKDEQPMGEQIRNAEPQQMKSFAYRVDTRESAKFVGKESPNFNRAARQGSGTKDDRETIQPQDDGKVRAKQTPVERKATDLQDDATGTDVPIVRTIFLIRLMSDELNAAPLPEEIRD